MKRCAAAIAAIFAMSAAGCTSMSIRTTPLEKAGDPIEPADCAVRLFSSSSTFLKGCAKVGEMALGDAGFTRTKYCGALQVRDEVRKATCELGGNAAVISRISRPMVTCVEARAELYSCDPDRMPERPAWATLTSSSNPAER